MTATDAPTEKMHKVTVKFAPEGAPMDLFGTILRVIGTAYPDSLMAQPSQYDGGMVFHIPDSARPRKGTKKQLTAETARDADDVLVTDVGPHGIGFTLPEHIAAACLPIIKTAFNDNPAAVNYLEMKVADRSSYQTYLLTFARSAGQTPHALRQAAERKLDDLTTKLRAHLDADGTPEETLAVIRFDVDILTAAAAARKATPC